MPFNVQLNYKIYNKNAVLREAYPKDIRFFYTNTEGTLPQARRASVKEVGVCTLRARFAGAKPPQTKNLKIFFTNLKVFTMFYFLRIML
ncbi:hypothetical protein BPP43_04815 [Brachyspira pilosicoli P43/6/78]|uniref:Uncharacterized protein n=1 Tax=Brachyspira pilosicoli P43/6/78 TaxID=1042417 RepID=A0A3B6VJY7_BRAPL|nr:hypothetical protein BPP43_04815 [Brachyspira pilosicoli P43/6/78]